MAAQARRSPAASRQGKTLAYPRVLEWNTLAGARVVRTSLGSSRLAARKLRVE